VGQRGFVVSWRSGSWGRTAGGFTALSLASVVLVFAAASSEGYRTTSTDLHDGTVWTLSSDRDRVMRINARVDEFDTEVLSDVSEAQLFQFGTSVYLQTPEGFAHVPALSSGTHSVGWQACDSYDQCTNSNTISVGVP
jgi:hypothetical protein